MTIVTVGIDLAKNVFAVHGVDEFGKPALMRPEVPRAKLGELIANLPACLIGMEACAGAHHWAREFAKFGHNVRLMAPKFVSPYRMSGKRGKNDATDIVTQWEVVATCERISEAFLLPVLKDLIDQFPFEILGFHSDNGSEYINKTVAALLEKMRVEQTKWRSRHSNDNALAESKNGSVVRKAFGYSHIPQRFAAHINMFCREHLNPYVNLHRPCLFAKEVIDATGKIRKTYPLDMVQTPLDNLASLPSAHAFLRQGITIAQLQLQAKALSDLDAANNLNVARLKLCDLFNRRSKSAA